MDFCANPTTIKDTFFSERLHRVKKNIFLGNGLQLEQVFVGVWLKSRSGNRSYPRLPK